MFAGRRLQAISTRGGRTSSLAPCHHPVPTHQWLSAVHTTPPTVRISHLFNGGGSGGGYDGSMVVPVVVIVAGMMIIMAVMVLMVVVMVVI